MNAMIFCGCEEYRPLNTGLMLLSFPFMYRLCPILTKRVDPIALLMIVGSCEYVDEGACV